MDLTIFLFLFTENVFTHTFNMHCPFLDHLSSYKWTSPFPGEMHAGRMPTNPELGFLFQKSKILLFDRDSVLAVINVKAFVLLLDQLLRV